MLKKDVLMHEKLVKIPTPEFIVLYNGIKAYPEQKILRLSDAFYDIPKYNAANLELEVTVYNINDGHNPKIFESCAKLKEYAAFVGQTRKYPHDPREEAFKKAIQYCIEHNILREFLTENSTEVINMLTEWTWEEELQVRVQDALEEGREEGMEKDRTQVLALIDQGLSTAELRTYLLNNTRTVTAGTEVAGMPVQG
jgi:hypothetical protein